MGTNLPFQNIFVVRGGWVSRCTTIAIAHRCALHQSKADLGLRRGEVKSVWYHTVSQSEDRESCLEGPLTAQESAACGKAIGAGEACSTTMKAGGGGG